MSHEPESMLAIDVGSAYVKAALVDRVGDAHRFIVRGLSPQVAPTNPNMPPTVPIGEAVRDLESLSGRRVLGSDGRPLTPEDFGAGVDVVGGAVSALGRLEAAVAAIRDDRSVQAAEAALRGVPSRLVAKITGKDIAGRGDAFEKFAQKLRDNPPHLVILVGGTDRKPDRVLVTLAEAVAVAVSLVRPHERPTLVYAGPGALRPAIIAAVSDRMPVVTVDNVTPDDRRANPAPLRNEIDGLYVSILSKRDRGAASVVQWCGPRVATVGRAMLRAFSYRDVDVLAADVGARHTILVRSARGQVLVEPDCGVGQGAEALVAGPAGVGVRLWLDPEVSDEAVQAWALNKGLRPWLRCTTPEECAIEMAFARQALRRSLAAAQAGWREERGDDSGLPPKVDTVIGGGAVLSGTRSQAEAAAALIDGLQPVGVSRLALDSGELAPALGAVAEANPAAVRSVLERDAIVVLGTLIAPLGPSRPGRAALRLEIEVPGGGRETVEVISGSIVRLPLAPGLRAKAVIRPVKPYDVVVGSPGQGLEVEVQGGPLGVIIDARGRPLPDLQRLPDRAVQLRGWAAALGA